MAKRHIMAGIILLVLALVLVAKGVRNFRTTPHASAPVVDASQHATENEPAARDAGSLGREKSDSAPEGSMQARPSQIVPAPQERLMRPLARVIPSSATVRAEVARNPHVTPPSILSFSLELGERFDRALRSSEESEKLMRELEKCATEDVRNTGERLQSVRALCLLNARHLSEQRPELKNAYSVIEAKVPDAIRKLSNVAN